MKIVILGGSGLIGTHLTAYLQSQGHELVWLSRNPSRLQVATDQRPQVVAWPVDETSQAVHDLADAQVVINLAGESLNQRWTPAARKRIMDSRILSARQLVELINRGVLQPHTFVQGSAVGFYGTSDNKAFTENDRPGGGFLADVCHRVEQEAEKIDATGVRLVKIRLGVVLGRGADSLKMMALPFKLFTGGRVGSGRQWIPWIHIEDVSRMIEWFMLDSTVSGPYNAVAPEATRMDDLGRTLAGVLGKPFWLPVPAFVLRVALGERASLVLDSQLVKPGRVLEQGYVFRYPRLEAALQEILA